MQELIYALSIIIIVLTFILIGVVPIFAAFLYPDDD